MTATNSMLFDGPNLEEVLAEARLCFGPDIEIKAANRVRRGGLLGFFSKEWFEVWATPAADAVGPFRSADHDEADTFHSMVQHALADRETTDTPDNPKYDDAMDRFFGDDRDGKTRPLMPVSSAEATQNTAALALLEREAEPQAASAPERRITPTLASPVEESTPASVALEDAPRGESVFATVTAPRAKTNLLWAMLDKLDDLPIAPQLPTEGLVVFVGEATAALETARRIGAATSMWTGDVPVLSRHSSLEGVPTWLVINDLAEASCRADRWRQRAGLVPVVIDQPIDGGNRAWATEAVTALNAAHVRLTAEAWRLPSDVGALAAKLGGVDALDLVAVADSMEPLAMLDLNIPVSTVEGRQASAELLAAVWLENRRAA